MTSVLESPMPASRVARRSSAAASILASSSSSRSSPRGSPTGWTGYPSSNPSTPPSTTHRPPKSPWDSAIPSITRSSQRSPRRDRASSGKRCSWWPMRSAWRLDEVRCVAEYAQTTDDLQLPGDWTIKTGCVAGIDVRWKGLLEEPRGHRDPWCLDQRSDAGACLVDCLRLHHHGRGSTDHQEHPELRATAGFRRPRLSTTSSCSG